MVVHAFDPRTQWAETGRSCELEASQVYIVRICLKTNQINTQAKQETILYRINVLNCLWYRVEDIDQSVPISLYLLCVYMCVHMCVCIREKERERESVIV